MMRIRPLRQTAGLLACALLLTATAMAEEPAPETAETPAEVSAEVTAATEAAVEEPAEAAVEEPAEAAVETPEADWRLLLVNPWNTLPEGYTVELVKLKNGMQVDRRIYDDLNDMLTDCWAAGLRPLVCSAYRTQATQTRLYNNKAARLRAAGYGREAALTEAGRWVAVPGTSEHQTGMALDLISSSYQLLDEKQEETAEQKWLMEHCWEYGFILRYPNEKSAVTGIGYEPWHYRYVGRENAAAIRESELCLEEYLAAQAAEAAAEELPGEAVGETVTETDIGTESENTAAA